MAPEKKNIIGYWVAAISLAITAATIIFNSGVLISTTKATNATLPEHIQEDKEFKGYIQKDISDIKQDQSATRQALIDIKELMKTEIQFHRNDRK